VSRLSVNDQGAAPTAVIGAQTTAAGIAAGSHDTAGVVTFTTSGAAAAGVQTTVTFGTPINGPVFVSLDAGNTAASGSAPVANANAQVTTDAFGRSTGFTVNTQAAPANTTAYALVYTVMT
jgi:hypothetical protein